MQYYVQIPVLVLHVQQSFQNCLPNVLMLDITKHVIKLNTWVL